MTGIFCKKPIVLVEPAFVSRRFLLSLWHRQARTKRVEEVIKLLNIEKCADTAVCSATVRSTGHTGLFMDGGEPVPEPRGGYRR